MILLNFTLLIFHTLYLLFQFLCLIVNELQFVFHLLFQMAHQFCSVFRLFPFHPYQLSICLIQLLMNFFLLLLHHIHFQNHLVDVLTLILLEFSELLYNLLVPLRDLHDQLFFFKNHLIYLHNLAFQNFLVLLMNHLHHLLVF